MYTLTGVLLLIISWFIHRELFGNDGGYWLIPVLIICGLCGLGSLIYGLLPLLKIIS